MERTYWQIDACFVIQKDDGSTYPKERVSKLKTEPNSKDIDNWLNYMWENLGDVYVKSVDYTVWKVDFTEVNNGTIQTVE